jgi:sigma-B regulation protein RsbU (phosphoserine phosphatase)
MPEEPEPTIAAVPSSTERYESALVRIVSGIEDEGLRKKVAEVLALLDFNSTLNRSLELADVLDLVLYVSMGQTRAGWAGVLLRGEDDVDVLVPAAHRGRRVPDWPSLRMPLGRSDEALTSSVSSREVGPSTASWVRDLLAATQAGLLIPLWKGERLVGVLLLGERDAEYSADDRLFAETLCVSAAASIDNGRIYQRLQELNRGLSFRVYQLRSLFDITRELNRQPDLAKIRQVLLNAAMGHVLTTRAVVLLEGTVTDERGVKLTAEDKKLLESKHFVLRSLSEEPASKILDDSLRSGLERLGLDTVVPLRAGESCHGALLLGPSASGKPLGEEDIDFLRSLGAQAGAALDNIRLTEQWVEKQKIEKEMALARDIQRGLLPDDEPDIEGWDLAGINIPCLTVGGDYYDYIDRGGGQYWIVIADVSGKGTGAALIMASVRAALHALSGLGAISLDAVAKQLNDIVYESTEMNRYVTAFFGSLDTRTGELEFVNAGHCYPVLLRSSGEVERLAEGSPVVGLLPKLEVKTGRARLESGDLLLLYTDGLSETTNPRGEEFGEEKIFALVRESAHKPSRDVVARLLSEARVFAAEAGLNDDLTLVAVQRG